jgi:amino acid transporter
MESIGILLIILSVFILLSIIIYFFADKIGKLFEGFKDFIKIIKKKPSKYFFLLIFYIFILIILILIFIMIINGTKLKKSFGTTTLYIITIILFIILMLYLFLIGFRFNDFFETSFNNENNYSKKNYIL